MSPQYVQCCCALICSGAARRNACYGKPDFIYYFH
jgi:hypothetical protein